MRRLTDLREILHYVPGYRDQLFVIAVDGVIVEDANFANLLTDVALLRSLNVHVVLIHGMSHQLRRLADERSQAVSNDDGTGVTDESTYQLALTVANRVSLDVLAKLAAIDLHGAVTNAVVAHPAGILKGLDMQWTGRVDRIDVGLLRALLEKNVIPVLPPLGIDGGGSVYRLNSDALAVEIAAALKAKKLLFASSRAGIECNGELVSELSLAQAEAVLRDRREELDPGMVSKLQHACLACRRGVDRVHVVNGRLEEGILAETFSNEGVGTLVYNDDYQVVRPAATRDVPVIAKLIQKATLNDEVMPRSNQDVESQLNCYYLFEIDGNPVACVALIPYPDERKAELASLIVSGGHENYGIGRRLVDHVEQESRRMGFHELFCLSTQAFNFFRRACSFQDGSADDLPHARRQEWERNGRNSRVLRKPLGPLGATQ